MNPPRGFAFRLGLRLGRYRLILQVVAGLERVIRWAVIAAILIRWAVIAAISIGALVIGVYLLMYLLMYLNYAPLWSRVYSSCVDSQPEAASVTEALRRRSECMRWASAAVEEQMKLDETSRGKRR